MGNKRVAEKAFLRIAAAIIFFGISISAQGQCPCSGSTWVNNSGVTGYWTNASTWTANSGYPPVNGSWYTLCINGNVTLNSSLITGGGGDITICGNLTVNGDATIPGNLKVNGSLTVTGNLTVSGGATFTNGSLTVGQNFTVNSNAAVFTGTGSNTISVGGNFNSNAPVTINGYKANITGNMVTSSNALTIGNITATTVTVHGSLTSTNTPINVMTYGELVVFGDWNVSGGSNSTITGNMAVKGNLTANQGINITNSGNLLIFGTASITNGTANIQGDLFVSSKITVPGYYTNNGGNIYSLDPTSKFGTATVSVGLSNLQTNGSLYTQYLNYQNVFGLTPFTATIAFSPSSPVCAGTSVTYTATATGATSYKFYVNGSSTAAYSGTNSYYTYAPANGDVVSVTVSNGTSTATAASSAIVVNALPSTPVLAATNICAGSSAALSITNGQSGYTYAWSVSYPYTLTSSGTSSPILAVPSNSTLFSSTSAILLYPDVSVTVTSNGCSTSVSNTSQKLIVVYRIPVTGPPFHIGNSVAK